MPDFLVPERTVTIELGDTDYAGAEIVVRTSIPLAVYFRIDQMLADLAAPDKVLEAIDLFCAEGLVEWNLADRHGSIPATAEGMREHLEPVVIGGILRAWIEEVGTVGRPLPAPSPAGDTPDARPGKTPRRRSVRRSSLTPSADAGPATP